MVRKFTASSLVFVALLSLASCASEATVTPNKPAPSPVSTSIGLMVLTLTNLNQPEIKATLRPYNNALSNQALEQIDDGLDIKFVNNKVENVSGRRYLNATFEVRNAQACANKGTCPAYTEDLVNGTFIAADTTTTLGSSAINRLILANGQPADPALVNEIQPTHALLYNNTTRLLDVVSDNANFQAFSEAEVASLAINTDTRVNGLFPWGFSIVNRNDRSNTLTANPANNQYDGVVTFAFSYPHILGSENSINEISIVVQATANTANRVTEGIHEQGTNNAEQRADALNPEAEVALLGNSPTPLTDNAMTRICALRYAGTKGDPVYLFEEKTDFCGMPQEQTGITTTNQAIADNNKIVSQITIAESGEIGELEINVQFDHARASDLTMDLVSPQGTSVRLFYDYSFESCSTITSFNITFRDHNSDDSYLPQIIEYCANPAEDAYRPDRAFSAFTGENIQGTWSLYVRDIVNDPPAVQGNFKQWSINAHVTPEPFMHFYVTQGTQNTRGNIGTVPLLSNRRALARAFLTPDILQSIGLTGNVQEARLFAYGANGLIDSVLLSIPNTIPSALNEEDVQSSFNAYIPNAWLQTGLQFKLILTSNSGRYRYPETGFLTVPNVLGNPELFIDFIPIENPTNDSSRPPFSVADVEQQQTAWVYDTQWMLPVPTETRVQTSVLSTYVTMSETANDVVIELRNKYIVDETTHHYVGIGDYNKNYIAFGETPGKVVSLGISRAQVLSQPNYNRTIANTVAHELGHNWNLQHTPCGRDIRPNLAFPYADGSIGVWGINLDPDLAASVSMAPFSSGNGGYRDVMSYCRPRWISDFKYVRIADYRAKELANQQQSLHASQTRVPATLISGKIDANGQVTLKPAFDFEGIITHSTHDTRNGLSSSSMDNANGYVVEMRDAAHAVLASIPFTPQNIDHDSSQSFHLVVPRIHNVAHITVSHQNNRSEMLAQRSGHFIG